MSYHLGLTIPRLGAEVRMTSSNGTVDVTFPVVNGFAMTLEPKEIQVVAAIADAFQRATEKK